MPVSNQTYSEAIARINELESKALPAIRFIVQTWSAWHKANGWHTRISLIKSTRTGKYLYVTDVSSHDGTAGEAGRAINDHTYESVHDVEIDVPVNEIRRIARSIATHHAKHATVDRDLTPEMIRALEEV